MRWIKKLAIGFASLAALVVFVAWLILSSEILAGVRGKLTAQYLSGKFGQVVQINGGVSVDLGPVLHIKTDGLVLPSRSMPGVTLAEIGELEFDVALDALWQGTPDPSNLAARKASVVLMIDAKGVTSWSGLRDGSRGATGKKAKRRDPISFLSGHTLRFSDSHLLYQNARNGLDLNLALASLELEQAKGTTPVSLKAEGALNGENVSLIGTFPAARPIDATATFDHMTLRIHEKAVAKGRSFALSAEIAELGQLLDVLKLDRVLSGTGSISAVLKTSDDARRIEDLKINVVLGTGQSLELTGDLGVLGVADDVSVDTIVNLYTAENMPTPTSSRRDLKLTRVKMSLTAQPGGTPQRHMVIATTGFVLDTRGEGPPPVSITGISRTPDGKLRLDGVRLRLGPQGAPFLDVSGQIDDALQLKQIDFDAKLSVPAASLLAPEVFQTSDVLGLVSGGFKLQGTAQKLLLSDLKAASQGTDLWQLKVDGSVGNAIDLGDIALDISADVPSGAAVLTALNLNPVDTGPVKLSATLKSQGTDWKSSATITVAESQLDLTGDLDLGSAHPTLRGSIESDLIRVGQLRKVVAAAIELDKLKSVEKDAAKTGAAGDAKENSPFRDVTLQPIVQALLLSGADLEIDIDLRKIEGEKGTTSLTTKLEMKDEKVQLGPAKFNYDGSHFDVTGSMDLAKNPDLVRFSGEAGGWDFEKILHELHFKKGARGDVTARFDISGHRTSARNFLASMSGNATISMKNGSIDTQLLDLAGLGVLPWLFSKERRHVATIVCVRAPLSISNGRISSKDSVIETEQVQIVISGDVDLRNKTLDIAGQPRRIDKPLSRSPWPFTAKGPLSKPKLKVKDGPRRVRRADGASTMPKRRKICVPDILQLK